MKKIELGKRQKKILVITGCAVGGIAATFGAIFALKASYEAGRGNGAKELADCLTDWLQDEDSDTKLKLGLTTDEDSNLETEFYCVKAEFVDGKLDIYLAE